MKKKKWEKPELIILQRVQPGEAVLANCKGGGQGSNSLNKDNTCVGFVFPDVDCVFNCESYNSS
ncbi:MAG: hypothetical protein ACYSSI_13345 [Planctomycetota bacterium]|jgi:hypothetical protein